MSENALTGVTFVELGPARGLMIPGWDHPPAATGSTAMVTQPLQPMLTFQAEPPDGREETPLAYTAQAPVLAPPPTLRTLDTALGGVVVLLVAAALIAWRYLRALVHLRIRGRRLYAEEAAARYAEDHRVSAHDDPGGIRRGSGSLG